MGAPRPHSAAHCPRPTACATPPCARRRRPPLFPMRCRPLPPAAGAGGSCQVGCPTARAPRPTVAGGRNASSPRRHSPGGMASRAPRVGCRQRFFPQPSPCQCRGRKAACMYRPRTVRVRSLPPAWPPPQGQRQYWRVPHAHGAKRAHARACRQTCPRAHNVNPLRRQARNATANRNDWPQQPPPARRVIPMGMARPANRVARRLSPHPREWRLLRRFVDCLAGEPTAGEGCRFRPPEKRRHRHPTRGSPDPQQSNLFATHGRQESRGVGRDCNSRGNPSLARAAR